jgi:hypothetical protein
MKVDGGGDMMNVEGGGEKKKTKEHRHKEEKNTESYFSLLNKFFIFILSPWIFACNVSCIHELTGVNGG